MLTSTFWLDERLGGRCSPRHFDFDQNEIEQATILCLEEKVPERDWILAQRGVPVLHVPFPKIQPENGSADQFVGARITIQCIAVIADFFRMSSGQQRLIVHCGHGNDRTGLVLIGHLICNKGMNLTEAIGHLKARNEKALSYAGFEELTYSLFNIQSILTK